MKYKNLFLYVFILIHFLQLLVMVNMIKIGFDEFQVCQTEYTEIQYLSLYILILSIFEFASVMRFYIQLDMGGLIQLITLKVLRYFHLYASRLRYQTSIQRIMYLILDLVILESFLCSEEQTFSLVYHQYNKRVGLNVVIRNAFIVSEFF
jgi:hypothetical protein